MDREKAMSVLETTDIVVEVYPTRKTVTLHVSREDLKAVFDSLATLTERRGIKNQLNPNGKS